MRVLVVEDEPLKLEEVESALEAMSQNFIIDCARSVRSAIDHFRSGQRPAAIVLDMSLPTFDIEPGESGGLPKPFGGIEIMRYLERIELSVPIIILTGYPAFEDDSGIITLAELERSIRSEFPNRLISVIQYSVVSDEWIQILQTRMFGIIKQKDD